MTLTPVLQACPPRPELSDAREYAANLDKALADEISTERGAAWYARLFSDKPTLILVDELIHHAARAIQQGARGVDAKNVHLSVSALAHAIDASPRTVLVTTTPEQGHDAFRTDSRVQEIMDRIASELARVSHEMTPSSSDDLAAILRQRLFLGCDEKARTETSRAYAEIARKLDPSDADAESRFHAAYPFHPDLMSLIQNWLFANGDFQRVRGAIRMMANIVSGGKLGDAALIHPHHADVSIPRLHDHLIAGLRYEGIAPAITTDVMGEKSTAESIGTAHAQRIANTVLLASLAPKSVNGIDEARAVSAILTPDLPDPAVARAAFAEYSNRALFLDETPGRRGERFTQQPNVRRMVNDRKSRLNGSQVEDAVRDAIRAEYDQSESGRVENPLPVIMYPSRANGAPDKREEVYLCIVAPGNFNWNDREGNESVIAELHRERSGASDANREHRNNLIFLVAQDDDLSAIRGSVAGHMAALDVKKRQGRGLEKYQNEILDEIIARERKAVSQSVQNKWTTLIYPAGRSDLGGAAPHLAVETLTPSTDSEGNGQVPVIAKLIERHKIPDPKRPRLNKTVWDNTPLGVAAFESEGRTVGELHRVFTASPSRMMMLDRSAFRAVLVEAVRANDLYMESPTGQEIDAENVTVGIEDDFRVWIHGKKPQAAPQPPEPPNPNPEPNTWIFPPVIPVPDPTPSVAEIPDFTSETVKGNIAADALRGFMSTHRAGMEDVTALEIMSTRSDDLTYIADKMGSSLAGKASFRIEVLSQDGNLTFDLRAQTVEQWKERETNVNRIIGYTPDPVVDCRMDFSRDNCGPEDFAKVIVSFDNRRDVVLRAAFDRVAPEVE